MITPALSTYLQEHHVHYHILHHNAAYTAQELAYLSHVDGQSFFKIVMVMAEQQLTMLVIPAPYLLDFSRLPAAMNCNSVELAFEQEFIDSFPGCELGAMPPFGNLFNLPVWVSDKLFQQEYIYFNGGDFTETLKLRYQDFYRLVKPNILVGSLMALGSVHMHEHSRMGRLRH